jgi:hypothetical protein
MTECENGGQLEKEKPPERIVKRRAVTPPTPERAIPPRPTPPFKLSGSHTRQCQWEFVDGSHKSQCAYEKDGEGSFCRLHNWMFLYGEDE